MSTHKQLINFKSWYPQVCGIHYRYDVTLLPRHLMLLLTLFTCGWLPCLVFSKTCSTLLPLPCGKIRWHMSVIPVPRMMRKEDRDFEASLGYLISSHLRKQPKSTRNQATPHYPLHRFLLLVSLFGGGIFGDSAFLCLLLCLPDHHTFPQDISFHSPRQVFCSIVNKVHCWNHSLISFYKGIRKWKLEFCYLTKLRVQRKQLLRLWNALSYCHVAYLLNQL